MRLELGRWFSTEEWRHRARGEPRAKHGRQMEEKPNGLDRFGWYVPEEPHIEGTDDEPNQDDKARRGRIGKTTLWAFVIAVLDTLGRGALLGWLGIQIAPGSAVARAMALIFSIPPAWFWVATLAGFLAWIAWPEPWRIMGSRIAKTRFVPKEYGDILAALVVAVIIIVVAVLLVRHFERAAPLAYAPSLDSGLSSSSATASPIAGVPMTAVTITLPINFMFQPPVCWKEYSSPHGYPALSDTAALADVESIGIGGCQPIPTPPPGNPFSSSAWLLSGAAYLPELEREVPTTFYANVKAGTASIYFSVVEPNDSGPPRCQVYSAGNFYPCPEAK